MPGISNNNRKESETKKANLNTNKKPVTPLSKAKTPTRSNEPESKTGQENKKANSITNTHKKPVTPLSKTKTPTPSNEPESKKATKAPEQQQNAATRRKSVRFGEDSIILIPTKEENKESEEKERLAREAIEAREAREAQLAREVIEAREAQQLNNQIEEVLKFSGSISSKKYENPSQQSYDLINAAVQNNLEQCEAAIANGADVNFMDCSAAKAAILNGNDDTSIVKLLIDKGLNVNYKDKSGQTLLMTALVMEKTGIAKTIIEESNGKLVFDDEKNNAILKIAASKSLLVKNGKDKNFYENLARSMIENGAEIDERLKKNSLIQNMFTEKLVEGVERNDLNACAKALRNGANALDKEALDDAIIKNNASILKLLLDESRNQIDDSKYLDAKTEGKTLLMNASFLGKENAVKELINHGADVNLKDHNNKSAIMLAAQCGHERIVSILVENGAELEPETKKLISKNFPSIRPLIEKTEKLKRMGLDTKDIQRLEKLKDSMIKKSASRKIQKTWENHKTKKTNTPEGRI